MTLDPVTLTYYAIVCGCLAWVSPRLGPTIARLMAGVIVGVVAALLLPLLRRAAGL